jgi:hypothetical protein
MEAIVGNKFAVAALHSDWRHAVAKSRFALVHAEQRANKKSPSLSGTGLDEHLTCL